MVENKEKDASIISIEDIPNITRKRKSPKLVEDLQRLKKGEAKRINAKQDYDTTISGVRYHIKRINESRTEKRKLAYTLRKENNIQIMYVCFKSDLYDVIKKTKPKGV